MELPHNVDTTDVYSIREVKTTDGYVHGYFCGDWLDDDTVLDKFCEETGYHPDEAEVTGDTI